ncbi:MAG: hypothetical protein KGI08_03615 [Thaumarchaeota archaeon]|nr:hypothetical protein [Nitrososphaerota archaeon]
MSAKELTIPEMQKAISESQEQLKVFKANYETFKAEAEAKIKKAETEKEEIKKKIEEKGPDHEGKNAKFHKAMKAAMEETDEKKQAEAMKEAMKHYKADEEEDEEEKKEAEAEKEEKEAMKAELAKSRLQILTAAYKAAKVDDKKITEYAARWNKMSFKELDAEIDMIKPFIAKTVIAPKEEKVPLGFSTLQFNASTEDEFSASLKKVSDADLFNGGQF